MVLTQLSLVFFCLTATVLVLLIVLIAYFQWIYKCWSRQNIPYLTPQIPFGNLPEALKGEEHIGITLKRIYDKMKSKKWQFGGIHIFATPNLMILDLDLIKTILTRDFEYFVDKKTFYTEPNDPIGRHFANLNGNKWKNLRRKLTPTFTSSKMKIVFETLLKCSDDLSKLVDILCNNDEPIDLRDVVTAFTLNVIGCCAFGLDFGSAGENNSLFRKFAYSAITSTKFQNIKRHFVMNFPKVASFLRMASTNKSVSKYVLNLVENTVNNRKKHNVRRNDFLQMLIDLKNKDSEDDGLTMDEIAAHCFLFVVAGFEPPSITASCVLYQLSIHQDIQEKVRHEVHTVLEKWNGRLTYEALQEMKYMTQVIDETLRLYSSTPMTSRKCSMDYKIPNTDVVIKKDTFLIIPIMGIHYDPEYYPDPEKFDPDRFSKENKALRHNFAHLPFSDGPRMCFGMAFGLMNIKMAVATLTKNYKFRCDPTTAEPLQFDPDGLFMSYREKIWIRAEKLI